MKSKFSLSAAGLITAGLITAATPSAARASSFCAVTVAVRTPLGRPGSADVELIDSAHRTVLRTRTDKETGVARLCDFGFGEHSIEVVAGCARVTIHGVRLGYGRTTSYELGLPGCAESFILGCAVYFRVLDGEGSQLGGVRIGESDGQGGVTDEYGRARLMVALHGHASFSFKAPGFKVATRELECEKSGQQEIQVPMERDPVR